VGEIVSEAADRAKQAGAPEQALAAFTEQATEQLIAQLDTAGLLEGPVFDELRGKMRDEFDSSDVLPPGHSADFADALVQKTIKETEARDATDDEKAAQGPAKLREQLERWMNQALEPVSDPSFDVCPRALITPHSDYGRGWLNYAHAWGRMRVVNPPDRVVILGVNHAGRGTGVVGCDKGYRTPLGTVLHDDAFAELLHAELGEDNVPKYYAEKYDHEREASVELQLPWMQHAFGDAGEEPSPDNARFPKVHAALMYDVSGHGGAPRTEDGLHIDVFVEALGKALEKAGGTTLIVAAAELSHVGKAFGDQQTFAGDDEQAKAFREKVISHDREMLRNVEGGKGDELLTGFAWNGNWSRWTGLGPMVASMRLCPTERVKVLNYAAAADNQGMAMIASMAGVIE